MSTDADESSDAPADLAPGEEDRTGGDIISGLQSYLVGLGLAVGLTLISFLLPSLDVVWRPAVPVALGALAIAQMGVHLVFFLHLTTAPDNTNNALALAFGVLVVTLVIAGSIWIMANLNGNMSPDTMPKHMMVSTIG